MPIENAKTNALMTAKKEYTHESQYLSTEAREKEGSSVKSTAVQAGRRVRIPKTHVKTKHGLTQACNSSSEGDTQKLELVSLAEKHNIQFPQDTLPQRNKVESDRGHPIPLLASKSKHSCLHPHVHTHPPHTHTHTYME